MTGFVSQSKGIVQILKRKMNTYKGSKKQFCMSQKQTRKNYCINLEYVIEIEKEPNGKFKFVIQNTNMGRKRATP